MIRRLKITPELWINFLATDVPVTLRVTKNALPSDAKCVRMEAAETRGEIILWIESAAFREDDPIDLPSPRVSQVEATVRGTL